MKRTELLLVITGVLSLVWLSCWINAELGDARFLIGWSAPLIWFFYWGDVDNEEKAQAWENLYDRFLWWLK